MKTTSHQLIESCVESEVRLYSDVLRSRVEIGGWLMCTGNLVTSISGT